MVAEGSWTLAGKNALSYAEQTGAEERIAHPPQQASRDSSGEVIGVAEGHHVGNRHIRHLLSRD
jgi:hypothetical protein